MQISLPMIPLEGDLEHTGDAWPFTSAIGGLADPTDPDITRFAQQSVEEIHNNDDRAEPPLVARHSFQPDDSTSNEDDDNSHNEADDFPSDDAPANILLSEDFDELFIEPASRQAQFIPPTALAQDDSNGARRSQRSQAPTNHYVPIDLVGFSATRMELQHHAAMHAANPRRPLDGPNFKLQSYVRAAFHAETQPPAAADLSTFSADDFAPTPTHWKHILSLPDHLKTPWIASSRKELLTLLRMETFTPIVTVESDDMIIPNSRDR
jgi:hypothetical protein